MTANSSSAQVRLAVALAHSIPGVRLQVSLRDATTVLVGAGCLGALTPCQFRSAILDPERGATLLDAIDQTEIAGGLADLGGGLYARGTGASSERWFATTLMPAAVGEALSDHPAGVPGDAFETILRADPELSAGAVGLKALHPSHLGRLDEVAHWALTRCLVAELLAATVLAP